jgi:NADPH2:quinone reductase
MYKDLTVRSIIVYAMPEAAKERAIDDIDKALSSNALQHRIAASIPLGEIVRGNEVIEQGSIRGAVILTIDQDKQ